MGMDGTLPHVPPASLVSHPPHPCPTFLVRLTHVPPASPSFCSTCIYIYTHIYTLFYTFIQIYINFEIKLSGWPEPNFQLRPPEIFLWSSLALAPPNNAIQALAKPGA